ncbi:hypothetical protein ACGFYA_20680 [Streptomyces sp. NPDC048305]|uniref:hypothetical protein n=1 Tax=Streptomyces sp. NPDC048305 TaxID=3365532 RepID=UPI0037102933
MSTATVTLTITNGYEDGSEVVTTPVVEIPLPIPEELNELVDWENDHIFPHTGTGKSQGDSWYEVEITKSTAPELLGRTFEFGF